MATSSSSRQENPETKKVQFPLDPASYQILTKIGYGVSSVVYKAVCIMNSAVVAIKSIDLDQSRADFDSIRRETKTLSLLSHPNILSAHCSFTVDHHLWVVMPFMSAGSLQSIIFTAFPEGLPEPCIAVVLKETLNAMSYLHNQGHLHRDIKAGNILIDSDGSVKLADFGVSASVYEAKSTAESSTRLTDITGTPYWMAPEVIHSHNGYGNKADIWSFGITALELAHGNPPLSNLPPSKSLLLKITKRFQFSDYETQNKDFKKKKFSKAFKDLVGSCLEQDQAKRPTAERLQRHPFFKNCRGGDSLVKNVLLGLPSVEERFKKIKDLGGLTSKKEEDDEGESVSLRAKNRRISGWNFNEDEFDLDPVFPTESSGSDLVFPTESFGDSVVKMVRFGGETVTHLSSPSGAWEDEGHMGANSGSVGEPSNIAGGAVEEEALAMVGGDSETGGEIVRVMLAGAESGEAILGGLSGNVGRMGGLERETMLVGLVALKRSLEEQRQNVMNLIGVLGGGQEGGWEVSREQQMRQETERLRTKLDNEREKNFRLEMELEFVRIQISAERNNVTGGGGTTAD